MYYQLFLNIIIGNKVKYEEQKDLFCFFWGINSIALLPMIDAKCSIEENAKEDKSKAKATSEKITNFDKNESNKTGEDSRKVAYPIFKEKYAVILGRFQKALVSLKDFDNEGVKEISNIISSIQGEQPEKLEQAFKKLIKLFAEEIKKRRKL
ncbi:hypothetical protein [Mycoplasmopsis bovis]|uniref:hypothetical protein n=1 Tax=Mycoplasmopsis bovis TaxID=28903 RepID=UPI003D2D2A74